MKHSTLTMFRRVMALSLALLLVVGLTGCFGKGDDKVTDPTTAVDPTTASTDAATEAATDAPTEAATEAPTEPAVKGVMGTVSANNLNVRSNPSTDSTVLSQLPVNLRIEVLEQKSSGGTNWGRIADMTLPNGTKVSGGWLNLHYVKLDTTETQTPAATESSTGTSTGTTTTVDEDEALGTITAEQLTIRKNAGTTYDSVGTYKKGDRVKILEKKTVSGTTWGKTEKGWISMTYVKLDGALGTAVDTGTNVKQPGATTPTTSSGSSSSSTGTGTTTATVDVTNGKTTVLGYVVVDCDGLTLRTGPSTSYKSMGTADEGDRYPYYQIKNEWYRTSHGWLSNASGAYLYIEGTTASDAGIATVTTTEMYVRQGPGTNFKTLTTLKKGESLVVLGRADGWGYTRLGWINIDTDYVSFTKGLTYKTGTAKVIADALNVRAEATDDSTKLGALKSGSEVTVTEIHSTNKSWGKISYDGKTGWINMSYLKMTSTSSSSSSSSSTGTYTISIPATSNGTVTASAASCAAGTTVTLYTTPATDFKVGSVSINNGAVTATNVTGTTNYTFTMPAANVTVNVTFIGKDSTEHTVTINAGANGTVVTTTGASKFASGTTVSLTVTPAAGYELDAISATNISTTDSSAMNVDLSTAHSFTMPAGDVRINATFKKVAYTMTPATDLTGGTVVNADTSKTSFNYDDTVTLTVTPAEGYKVKAVTVTYNGSNTITPAVDTTTATKYTFKMPPANATVTATFEKINYTVTVDSVENGTVSVDKTTATIGDEITVTATPATGYELDTVKVNGTAISGTKFNMPAANVTVTVTFKASTPST